LDEHQLLTEVIYDPYGNPIKSGKGGIPPSRKKEDITVKRGPGVKAARSYLSKKGTAGAGKSTFQRGKPKGVGSSPGIDKAEAVLGGLQDIDKALKDLKKNKDIEKKDKELEKPGFKSTNISNASINLEPTWVTLHTKKGVEQRLGIKVVPMMIEGFNVKHAISTDMQRFFLTAFGASIGRVIMRRVYRLIDKWTMFGSRPRGDVRQDVFYARTGHDGQPFILIDKNEDIPKLFFAQPQNMLKLWRMSWGNLVIADDVTKTVMFCMKKYKGMCSNFTYSMVFAQTREMAKVFEDMEDARKASGALFKMNKKISSMGGGK
jgi:hypothetical protein